jgi:hypothetical protein
MGHLMGGYSGTARHGVGRQLSTRRRAQGATLQELADSYDRSISTLRRATRPARAASSESKSIRISCAGRPLRCVRPGVLAGQPCPPDAAAACCLATGGGPTQLTESVWPRPVSVAAGSQRHERAGWSGPAPLLPLLAAGSNALAPYGRGKGRDTPRHRAALTPAASGLAIAVALAVVGLSLQWRARVALLKGSVMGSHWTLRWREMASNARSPCKRDNSFDAARSRA